LLSGVVVSDDAVVFGSMNTILEWDRELFLWLQDAARTSWGDVFFPWLTDADHFRIPLVIFWVLLMILGGGRGRKLGILLVVSVLLTDQISASVLKPWVDRIRPCFALEDVALLIPQSRSPSFPSSHAANSFGVAVLVGLALGRWGWTALLLALAISFSRVYVGVHYPLDVTAGALLGAGIGCLIMGSLGSWLRLGGRRKAVSSPAPADSPDAGSKGRFSP
jgi:undecaprenyl-diphosphatase